MDLDLPSTDIDLEFGPGGLRATRGELKIFDRFQEIMWLNLCLEPVAPDFTSVSYYATLDTISILGNVSAVAATGSSGGITSYKFTEGTPNVTVAPQSSAVDSNMTIGTSGSSLLGNETMYNLTFVSVFTDSIGCPSGEEGTATTVLLLCTGKN